MLKERYFGKNRTKHYWQQSGWNYKADTVSTKTEECLMFFIIKRKKQILLYYHWMPIRPLIELNDPIYLKNENGIGCGANFSRWDKILYREPNVEIITNVIMSRPLKFNRDACKGALYPLCYLYKPLNHLPSLYNLIKKPNCCIHKARRTKSLHLLMMSLFILFFFF